ncbi:MAG: MarR family transcriptional regulator [Mangrovimonas sp.]|nr:MarR family transcriptional regulator [Mangrovimonas sp.]
MKNSKLLGQLIGILYRQSTTYFQKEFKPFGLGHSQGKVLRYININGKVLPKDIAEYYNLDKGSVTSLIKSLEKNDFLERETHPTDKRCFYLALSPKAKQIIPNLDSIFSNWSERLLEGFSEDDKDFLLESIQKMIDNVSE